MGTAGVMRAMAEALDKIAGSLIKDTPQNPANPTTTSPLLETWFDAAEAVEAGFADRVAEPVRIAARFDIGAFRNAPTKLAEAVPDEPETEAPDDVLLDAPDEPAMPTFRTHKRSVPRPWPMPSRCRSCRLAGQPSDGGQVHETEMSLTQFARRSSTPAPNPIPTSSPTRSPAGPAAKPWAM